MRLLSLPPKIKGLLIIGVLGIFLSTYYFFFYVFVPSSYIYVQEHTIAQFPALKKTDRITVIAPHLDDEGLGVGGLLAEARKMDIPVSVIFMTNGDANYFGADLKYKTALPDAQEYLDYGKTRQYEALSATYRLGIPNQDVYFMGLPDRGLGEILSPAHYDVPYTSPYTKVSSSPYTLTAIPHLPYTGKASMTGLTDLINKTQPTIIFAPLLQDQHPDHAATGQYVKTIYPDIKNSPHTYLYLVHYPKFPVPHGINPQAPLVPPPRLSSLAWESIPLPADIVEIKRQSVEDYASQIAIPQVRQLLRGLVRKNELVVNGF